MGSQLEIIKIIERKIANLRFDGHHIIRHDGTDYDVWVKNGKLYNEDGPVIAFGVFKVYYKNGKLHREDGPAIVTWPWLSKYYLNGKEFKDLDDLNYEIRMQKLKSFLDK